MPKNKQLNLIASVKTPNIGFINKYRNIINSGIRVGGYSVLVNYQSLLSNKKYLSLSPPIIFLYKI